MPQGYASSRCEQLHGVLGLREKDALVGGARGRGASRLSLFGKQETKPRKLRAAEGGFESIVPAGHSFTCLSVFESILRGDFLPLYTLDGIARRPGAFSGQRVTDGAGNEDVAGNEDGAGSIDRDEPRLDEELTTADNIMAVEDVTARPTLTA